MDTLSVTLHPRTVTGKRVKQIRKEGLVPVHMYGSGIDDMALQVQTLELRKVLIQAGANVPISVTVEGNDSENVCFVREVQRHPVSEDVLHVDFLRVDVTQTVTADVPITLTGISPAVEDDSGVLIQAISTVNVEALPMDMPESLELDISVIEDFDTTLRVADISGIEGFTIHTDADLLVASVVPPRVEEEPVLVGEEELLEGEEVEEGEEAPAAEGEEASEEGGEA